MYESSSSSSSKPKKRSNIYDDDDFYSNSRSKSKYKSSSKLNKWHGPKWKNHHKPTIWPTPEPTPRPTPYPITTPLPTQRPTKLTKNPTQKPSKSPISEPTQQPTFDLTTDPTRDPTKSPIEERTYEPTNGPTTDPTDFPSSHPTFDPTEWPTSIPTNIPTDFPTTDPTTDPTKSPTEEPTEEPTGKYVANCPSQIKKGVRFSFIILYDNSCGLCQSFCNELLEGIGELVQELLYYPYINVQTMEFETNGKPETIVGFNEYELQKHPSKYIETIRRNGECTEGGKGSIDLLYALKYASYQFNRYDNRHKRIIVISACIDNSICFEKTLFSYFHRNDIDVYAVNLIRASKARNVINKDIADQYLLCITENKPNRICIGDNTRGVKIEEFDEIIQDCLLPKVCMTPKPTPTPKPTKRKWWTAKPTHKPTQKWPTHKPTNKWPTHKPTEKPISTPKPTIDPTDIPTSIPTTNPTDIPTSNPTTDPTDIPTPIPTTNPTKDPTKSPTIDPTSKPTEEPTKKLTDFPTSNPTKEPVQEPTPSPIRDICPDELREGEQFDFIVLFDNSCSLNDDDCDEFLEGVGEIISSLLDNTNNTRVQTMQIQPLGAPHVLVSFNDDRLQMFPPKYIRFVRQLGECRGGGNGDTDLYQALNDAVLYFDITDQRIDKIIVVSACTDNEEEAICNEIAPKFNKKGIDVYAVNLIKASETAENVIYSKNTAIEYLLCITDNNRNRICPGKDEIGVKVEEFTDIIEMCLLPGICIPPTINPTTYPTIIPTDKPTYIPTIDPTTDPTKKIKTKYPTKSPIKEATNAPTTDPTTDPTKKIKTKYPTKSPIERPTDFPSNDPTKEPTEATSEPTEEPTEPTPNPTDPPTKQPTPEPTEPTSEPTPEPTEATPNPTDPPTGEPTKEPTKGPTAFITEDDMNKDDKMSEKDDDDKQNVNDDDIKHDEDINDDSWEPQQDDQENKNKNIWRLQDAFNEDLGSKITTKKPTSSPIGSGCNEEITMGEKFDFVVFIDNSCKLSYADCDILLEGVGEIISNLLHFPITRVATIDFGEDANDVEILVGFDDNLQKNPIKYIEYIRQKGECTDNGNDETDLISALETAINLFDDDNNDDNKHKKFIIVSVCKDDNVQICKAYTNKLHSFQIDSYIVNLIKTSIPKNVINDKLEASNYLLCLADNNKDRVCIGNDDESGINIKEFDNIIHQCLLPNICITSTPSIPSTISCNDDYIIFIDNSCGITKDHCNNLLQGVGNIINTLLDSTKTRVATLQFGEHRNNIEILVDFNDLELQQDPKQYIQYIQNIGDCTSNGYGRTNLFVALQMIQELIIGFESEIVKLIIISSCKDENDRVCEMSQELQHIGIETYIINLILSRDTSIDNVIMNIKDAKHYLLCLVDNKPNRICIGNDNPGVTVQEFDNIIQDCLIPEICMVSPITLPTPIPTLRPIWNQEIKELTRKRRQQKKRRIKRK